MEDERKIGKGRCKHCHELLDHIWFTALMTEEWSWNGLDWECTARHGLVTDYKQPIICPNCEKVVGTGVDFGFGEGFK